jgi:hypothetical protein
MISHKGLHSNRLRAKMAKMSQAGERATLWLICRRVGAPAQGVDHFSWPVVALSESAGGLERRFR